MDEKRFTELDPISGILANMLDSSVFAVSQDLGSVFDSRKVTYGDMKDVFYDSILTLDAQTMSSPKVHNLGSNILTFANGEIDIDGGVFNIKAIGATTANMFGLFNDAGGDMWSWQESGNLNLSIDPTIFLNDEIFIKTGSPTEGFNIIKDSTSDVVFKVSGNGSGNWYNSSSSYISIGEGAGLSEARFTNQGLGIYRTNTLKHDFRVSGGATGVYLFKDGSISDLNPCVIGGSSTFGLEEISLRGYVGIETRLNIQPQSANSVTGSPLNGDLVQVNTINGTFSSVGLWNRVAGTWVKLG
jgi:hypothetical protein